MTEPVLVREHYRGGGPGGDAGPGAAPPPGDGAPEPGGGGGFMSARWGPLPAWGWMALAGVLAVGAYFWIRRGQAGAATAAAQNQAGTSGTASASATDTGCYDAGGNAVPCSQADYASEIADLQAEIDNMQGSGSVPVATAGAGSTADVSVPDVTGDGTIQARATVQAAGLVPVVQGGSGRGGTVTAQSPGPGTTAQLGSQVTLTVTGGNRAATPAATTT